MYDSYISVTMLRVSFPQRSLQSTELCGKILTTNQCAGIVKAEKQHISKNSYDIHAQIRTKIKKAVQSDK